MADFDQALLLDAADAYALSNRGLAKLKMEQLQEALADISKAIRLDANCAYAYRNPRIYSFEEGDYQQALPHFEKAYESDNYTHMLQLYLQNTWEKMGAISSV
jgi:tetratricopeptide (TPR) repeat protein